MCEYPRLKAEDNVDSVAECLCRFVNNANDIFYPHQHDFYEIFIVLSGEVSHFINGKDLKLPEGSLVFIRPDDLHGFRYDQPESLISSHINLTFTRNTAGMLFNYLSSDFPSDKLLRNEMPPIVLLTPAEKEKLVGLISELNLANWQDKNALKIRMRAILADIFVRYFYSSHTNSDTEKPQWLLQLITEMESSENFINGTERMIALSGKTREHLSRSLKKYYNITMTEYINSLRINYACNLLINTDKSVLDISLESGFQSSSLFYKIFKAKNSLTPIGFRKKYQHHKDIQ